MAASSKPAPAAKPKRSPKATGSTKKPVASARSAATGSSRKSAARKQARPSQEKAVAETMLFTFVGLSLIFLIIAIVQYA